MPSAVVWLKMNEVIGLSSGSLLIKLITLEALLLPVRFCIELSSTLAVRP